MGLIPSHTWVGFATQSKLIAGVAGWTEWEGTMFRADDPSQVMCTFESRARHLGVGLAAGKAGHVVFFFNTPNIGLLEGKSFGDGADLTIGVPAGKLLKLGAFVQLGLDLTKAAWDTDSLMSIAQDVGGAVTTKSPTIVAIGIPGLDGVVGLARTHAFQGTIDIRRFVTRRGMVANL